MCHCFDGNGHSLSYPSHPRQPPGLLSLCLPLPVGIWPPAAVSAAVGNAKPMKVARYRASPPARPRPEARGHSEDYRV